MVHLLARSLAIALLLVAPAASAKPPTKAAAASTAKAAPKSGATSAKPAAKAPSKPAAKSTARSASKQRPKKTAKLEPRARRASPGKSVGTPTSGRLIGGARLADGAHLRIVPFYAPGDARWGLESLVSLIDGAARAVRKKFPDAVLSVGHLSRKGGGDIDRHASHESGRDADVGFFVKNHLGKPIYSDHFVPFKGDGTAPTWPGARFDDARNWAFIEALVRNPRVRISRVFVSSPIRARLLEHARKVGAPAAIRQRAAQLMIQPSDSLPHDDHFHVRIACPPGSSVGKDKCVEHPAPRTRAPNAAVAKQQRPSKARPSRPAPRPARPNPNAAAPPPPREQGASPARAEAPLAVDGPEEASSAAEMTWPDPEKVRPSKREVFIPSLAPIVPGLDSVVIAAPRRGAPPRKKAPPKPEPVDEPDRAAEAR